MGPLQEGSVGDRESEDKTVFLFLLHVSEAARLCSGVPWSGVLVGCPWQPSHAGV